MHYSFFNCLWFSNFSFRTYHISLSLFSQLKNMNLQIFLTDRLSQTNILPYSNQKLGPNRTYKESSQISAQPGDIVVLSANTEVPHLCPDQSFDAPLIVEWYQDNCNRSFSYSVGRVSLDLKKYLAALYFPDQKSLAGHLESIQVCFTELHHIAHFVVEYNSIARQSSALPNRCFSSFLLKVLYSHLRSNFGPPFNNGVRIHHNIWFATHLVDGPIASPIARLCPVIN